MKRRRKSMLETLVHEYKIQNGTLPLINTECNPCHQQWMPNIITLLIFFNRIANCYNIQKFFQPRSNISEKRHAVLDGLCFMCFNEVPRLAKAITWSNLSSLCCRPCLTPRVIFCILSFWCLMGMTWKHKYWYCWTLYFLCCFFSRMEGFVPLHIAYVQNDMNW